MPAGPTTVSRPPRPAAAASRLGARGEAGGEVGAVAHDRVRLPVGGADEPREDPARGDPGAQRIGRVGADDPEHRREQPALGVLDGGRRTGGEEVAEPADRHVDVEEGRAGLGGGDLDGVGERVDVVQVLLGGVVGDAADLDERDRGPPVVGGGAEQVGPLGERPGQEPLAGRAASGGERHERRGGDAAAAEQPVGAGDALLGADLLGLQERGGLVADQDPAGGRRGLQLQDARDVAAGHHGVERGVAGEQQRERAGVDADRHPQPRPGGRQVHVADGREDPVHVPGRVHGVPGVVLPGEQDEQRVAGELHHVPAVVGRRQQHGEDPRQRGDELLGALRPGRGQLLGEAGEPGDVHEHSGALDVEAPLGVVRDPVQQARDQRGGRDRDAQALPLPPWGLLRRMAGRDPAAPDPEGWCAGWGVASVPGEGRGPAPPDRGG